jgi:hypothetical protein
MRRQAESAVAGTPSSIVPAPRLAPPEATRRWAAPLQQIFEVDPLACPTCRGPMRIVAFITQTSVIDQILAHLRTRVTRSARLRPDGPLSRPRRPAHTRGRSACAAVPLRRHLGPSRPRGHPPGSQT